MKQNRRNMVTCMGINLILMVDSFESIYLKKKKKKGNALQQTNSIYQFFLYNHVSYITMGRGGIEIDTRIGRGQGKGRKGWTRIGVC